MPVSASVTDGGVTVTGNVAVAVRSMFRPVFASAFYSEVLAGVEAELERHDLNLLLTSLKRGDDLLRLVSERRADGVLYIGYDLSPDFLRSLGRQVPLVVVDGEVPGLSSVVSGNGEGARAATLFPKPSDTAIRTKITEAVYGIGPGSFAIANPTTGTLDGATYLDLKVTYTQSTDLLLFPGPTINVSRSKRVWIAS